MDRRPFAYQSQSSEYLLSGESTFSQQQKHQQRDEDGYTYASAYRPRMAYANNDQRGFALVSQQEHPPAQNNDVDNNNNDSPSYVTAPRTAKKVGVGAIWLLECTSCLVAAAALAATIAVLATYADKPLPNWPRLISINSMIAVLSAVFKAAMLLPVAECLSELKWVWFSTPRPVRDFDRFESASRGPWGSFVFLFRIPTYWLANLGALITIVALAVDPITQQITQYKTCVVPQPGIAASVARTSNFSAKGVRYGAGLYTLYPPMTAALYQGLLAPPTNASAAQAYICPSGNCTFSRPDEFAYRSLAMCSAVEDITSSIVSVYSLKNGQIQPNVYNFSLPSSNTTVYGMGVSSNYILATKAALPRREELGRTVFVFDLLMLNTTGNDSKTSRKAQAFHITMTPCVHEYVDVSVQNSIFRETVRSTTMLRHKTDAYGLAYYNTFSAVGDLPAFPGVDCSPSESPQGKKTLPSLKLPDGTPYINRSIELSYPGLQFYDPACGYDFGFMSISGLRNALDSFFNLRNLSSPDAQGGGVMGDAWLQGLYANGTANASSIQAVMDGLSNALTATMRSHGEADQSTPAEGVILNAQTCVGVRWNWLALPVVLLLLTVIFMLGTVIKSYRNTRTGAVSDGRTPWKSSLLPLLWCGLSDTIRRRHGTLDDVKNMQDHSDRLHVSLRRNGEWATDGYKQEAGSRARWTLREGD